MTRRKRFRRAGILCCHCLRNLAFRNAGRRNGSLILNEQFWINVDGNFLDVCTLEWCKLFADARGKHYWRKVVTLEQEFATGLLEKLAISQSEFDEYVKEVKAYRDRFVAHLDDDEKMQIPSLALIRTSASYLYDYILAHEDDGGIFIDAPSCSMDHYAKHLQEGKVAYEKARRQLVD